MLMKFKRLFITLSVILLSTLCGGCTENDTNSFIHIDFFYDNNNNYLKENTVIIGLGNSIFDNENQKILSVDDEHYSGIQNIVINVYVDNEYSVIDKVEIATDDFFSNKYNMLSQTNQYTVDTYKKTFCFDVANYHIEKYIKFVVSYDWNYQGKESKHYKELLLYGTFVNNRFMIAQENTK